MQAHHQGSSASSYQLAAELETPMLGAVHNYRMIFKSEQRSKVGGWVSRLFELEIIRSLRMRRFLHESLVYRRGKEPFFQRSADDSDYTRVIEILWQQDAGQRVYSQGLLQAGAGQWRDKSTQRTERPETMC